MGSPITFSGFNRIDFNLILNAVMEQERAPVRTLETQKRALEAQKTAFGTLASKLASLESSVSDLFKTGAAGGRSVATSDSTAVNVSASSTAAAGTYDIVVTELARAQVTPTSSTHTDKDTTIVATGGTLIIGGVTVTINGAVTLEDLADAINTTPNIGVTATIVSPSPGSYQLVLTGKSTGTANAFAITNNLSGGSGVTFGANTVAATDAVASVNGVTVTSATNTLDGAIAGADVTVLKKDPAKTITVTISEDSSVTREKVQKLVTTYNDLHKFAAEQSSAARRGERNNIGSDGVLRGLMTSLRSGVTSEYQVGGQFTSLAAVGIGFSQSGELTFDQTVFDSAVKTSRTDVDKLFKGSGGVMGAFETLETSIKDYTRAGGLVPDAQSRITTQVSSLSKRISDLEARLAIRRAALQREFTAADQAMTRLNNQTAQLQTIGGGFRLF